MNLDRMINNVAKKLQNISDPSVELKKGTAKPEWTELKGFGMYVKILYGDELAALTEEQALAYEEQLDEYFYRMWKDGKDSSIPEKNITVEQYEIMQKYIDWCDRKQYFEDRRKKEQHPLWT